MQSQAPAYGNTRERGPTVSYREIEQAARQQMAQGERPTVDGVRKILGRGSPNHITECMQRFWKDQAALNAGDPVAITRLPPELAESAQAQWEQALRLAQQTAVHDNTAARAKLDELLRDTDVRARSLELREKEWDMAARVRERALADAREQVGLMMKELAADRAAIRARDLRIADLESQLQDHRLHLATVIARAIAKNQALAKLTPRRATQLKSMPKHSSRKRVQLNRRARKPKR